MKYTDKELFSNIKTYSQLARLLRISESQANRLWRGVCPMSETQRELLMIKLGLSESYVSTKEGA